jgi:hypothetical protein
VPLSFVATVHDAIVKFIIHAFMVAVLAFPALGKLHMPKTFLVLAHLGALARNSVFALLGHHGGTEPSIDALRYATGTIDVVGALLFIVQTCPATVPVARYVAARFLYLFSVFTLRDRSLKVRVVGTGAHVVHALAAAIAVFVTGNGPTAVFDLPSLDAGLDDTDSLSVIGADRRRVVFRAFDLGHIHVAVVAFLVAAGGPAAVFDQFSPNAGLDNANAVLVFSTDVRLTVFTFLYNTTTAAGLCRRTGLVLFITGFHRRTRLLIIFAGIRGSPFFPCFLVADVFRIFLKNINSIAFIGLAARAQIIDRFNLWDCVRLDRGIVVATTGHKVCGHNYSEKASA